MLDALGKDKPFIGTSAPMWDVGDEDYVEDMELEGLKMHSPRGNSDLELKTRAKEGYRTAIVRLPPSVHGPHDPNFVTYIVAASKKHGHVGYVGDGEHKWVAVHVKDAARLYVATLEGLANGSIPSGQTVHAVEDSGHPTKVIAELIASDIGNADIGAITPEQSRERYSPYIGTIWGTKRVMKSDITRKVTGWVPKENTLAEDIKAGVYSKVESH
jgi:nucleoside-diphosphate-sugar epimerase